MDVSAESHRGRGGGWLDRVVPGRTEDAGATVQRDACLDAGVSEWLGEARGSNLISTPAAVHAPAPRGVSCSSASLTALSTVPRSKFDRKKALWRALGAPLTCRYIAVHDLVVNGTTVALILAPYRLLNAVGTGWIFLRES